MDPTQQPQTPQTPHQPQPNNGAVAPYPVQNQQNFSQQPQPTVQPDAQTYQIPTHQQPFASQPQAQYPQHQEPVNQQSFPPQPIYPSHQGAVPDYTQPQSSSYEPPQPAPVAEPQVPQPQPIVDPTYQTYVNYYYEQQQGYVQPTAMPEQQLPEAPVQPAPQTTLPHNPIQTQQIPDSYIPTEQPQTVAQVASTYEIPSQAQVQPTTIVTPTHSPETAMPAPAGVIDKLKNRLDSKDKKGIPSKLKPFIGAALAGILIFAIFNSQLLVGQLQYLISPKAGTDAPSITETGSISSEPVVIIPKINVNAPVVYDVTSFDEAQVQKALERGVVHYGTTALPGQAGNNVIVGHSSNNWWASGKYKFAFVLLDKLEKGDTFELHYQGKKYVYEVFEKKVVQPNDVSVLSQTAEPITTLITCTPPGTSWQRLVVQGKQISPSPTEAAAPSTSNVPTDKSLLPSNTPSFWQQIKERFFGGGGGS